MGDERWIASSRDEAAHIVGLNPKTLQGYGKRGMPGERGRWPLKEIIDWLRKHVWEAKPVIADADPLMGGPLDSPALERYRLARAQQEEIRLSTMRREFLPVEAIRNTLALWARHMRGYGTDLQRLGYSEPFEMLNQTLDEMDRELLNSHLSTNEEKADGLTVYKKTANTKVQSE